MRAITLLRALSWVGFALAAWSLNLRWGDDPALGNGPPGQWERQVVGAALLGFVAAISLSWAHLPGRGGWIARGLAVAGGGGAVAIALWLRGQATDAGRAHLLAGSGWTWMMIGAALVLGAASASLALRAPVPVTAPRRSGKARPGRR